MHHTRFLSPIQYIRIYIIVSLVSYTVTHAILSNTNTTTTTTTNQPPKSNPRPLPPPTTNTTMGGKKSGTENTKRAAGNAKKAEAAAAKQAVAEAKTAAVEDEKWSRGAKSNKKAEDAEAKKAEAAAKKAERERLLAEEEKNQPSKAKGQGKKVAEKKTMRGPALDLAQLDAPSSSVLNASGIDNALDALSLTASTNQLKLERHPERRFKAAYEAFEAWRLPQIIEENKGSSLRRNQMVEMCRKEFEKRPENPFNQVGNVAHNATKEELLDKKAGIREGVERRLGGE